jgi:hypothetical protein
MDIISFTSPTLPAVRLCISFEYQYPIKSLNGFIMKQMNIKGELNNNRSGVIPERSARWWHIQSCKSTNALSCISLTNFKDILIESSKKEKT